MFQCCPGATSARFVPRADDGEICSSCGPAQLPACEPSPDRSVYKCLSEEVLCSVCALECVYLCEHDPGLRHVKRSGNKCGRSTYERHMDPFSKVQT